MTTETSNARGGDYRPVASGNAPHCPTCECPEQVSLAAAPPPAAAREDVRGLVGRWRNESESEHHLAYKLRESGDRDVADLRLGYATVLHNCAAELESALAAEGVQSPVKSVRDAAQYLIRYPGDDYAQRHLLERIDQLEARLTAAQQQGQVVACGGCGNADPEKVCIGCLHPFAAPPSAPVGVEAALRDALQLLIDFIELDKLAMDADALFIAKRALAQQPAADQFIATFRCENNGIVGTTDAKVHSVTRHDDGRIEVVIDHWPKQPAAVEGARDLIGALQVAELALRERGLQASGEYRQIEAALAKYAVQQPAAGEGAYPTPRNRAEAVALARLALAHLGVIDAHIDAAIARCETDLATQQQEPTTCKHDFRRDEDHGGACCQLCGEVRQ
jgi:hypothetical protein